MYSIIGDYIAIVSTFNKSEIRPKSGKTVNSLVQVKALSKKEFGTIIPEALYYKIKKTISKEEADKHTNDSKETNNNKERTHGKADKNKEVPHKKKYENYVETITIYRFLKKENNSEARIRAIPIYRVFLINFSAIPFEEQINFFRWIVNKRDDLLFAYLISFVTKSELTPSNKDLFKKKKDAIEHLFYNAHLPIEINDNYSTTLCMVARNLRESEELQTTMIRSIVLKASEIIFKERLFSDIDEWDFFHKYSFNKFYRFINFFLYKETKWITYFIIIPIIAGLSIIGLNFLLHHSLYLLIGINSLITKTSTVLARISTSFAKNNVLFAKANAFFTSVSTFFAKINPSFAKTIKAFLKNNKTQEVILQSMIILFATVLILFYVLDAYISGAQKKEARFIKNVFLRKTYYSFAIPLKAVCICRKVISKNSITMLKHNPTTNSRSSATFSFKTFKKDTISLKYYPTIQSFIKDYSYVVENRIFGETNNDREIMKSLITKFLPNYITARDNALFNILWRQ